jgi:hypothetical protein
MTIAGCVGQVAAQPAAAAAPSDRAIVVDYLGGQDKIDTYRDELRLDIVVQVPHGSVDYTAPTGSSYTRTGLRLSYNYYATFDPAQTEPAYINTLDSAAGADRWADNVDQYYTIHEVISSGASDYLVISIEGDLNIPDNLSGSNTPGGLPGIVPVSTSLYDRTGFGPVEVFNFPVRFYSGVDQSTDVTGPQVQMLYDDNWQLSVSGQVYWGTVLDFGLKTERPNATSAPGILPANSYAVPLQNAAFDTVSRGPACSISDSFWYAWVHQDGSLIEVINNAPVHVTGVSPDLGWATNNINRDYATYNAVDKGSPKPGVTNAGQPELVGGAMKADGSIDFNLVHESDDIRNRGYYRLLTWPESHDPETVVSTSAHGPCLSYQPSDLFDQTGRVTPAGESAQFTAATTFHKYQVPLPPAPSITEPVGRITDRRPVVRGTGTAGHTITLTDVTDPAQPRLLADGYGDGASITVAPDGTWAWPLPADLEDGAYVYQAEQTEHQSSYSLTSPATQTTFTIDTSVDPGSFSYDGSTFIVDPPVDPTDSHQTGWIQTSSGSAYYTGTLTAVDQLGRPLDGLTLTDIVFGSSSPAVEISPNVTHLDGGRYTVQFWSAVADASPTVSVSYQGQAIGQPLPIPFKAAPPVKPPPPTGLTDSAGMTVGWPLALVALLFLAIGLPTVLKRKM